MEKFDEYKIEWDIRHPFFLADDPMCLQCEQSDCSNCSSTERVDAVGLVTGNRHAVPERREK